MLPSAPKAQTYTGGRVAEQAVRPGSWWRLAAEEHPLREFPAPDHGLILMVSEARIIDGELHTIVLHPHPLWGRNYYGPNLKILAADFLRDFSVAQDGEELREVEIALVMARVQELSVEMQTPPDPMLLLERKKEEDATKSAGDSPEADEDTAQGEESTLPAGSTQVPAALLPSQDVVEAQKVIETRIAAFDAQKNWLTSKTDEIKSNMELISSYQMEKVNSTMASISEEASRAESLLQNVQTMRLFLGEEMAVTPLLEGKGADPSEPLTMMQRLLFLDEEIIINDVLEGFSTLDMHPEDLSALFSKDFSLVERMLPYPRCAAIVRVRRNHRQHNTQGMDIAQLFALITEAQADMRVHILVRDGERLSMITADSVTSNAERFFPSNAEINALFQKRSYHDKEIKEILPDNVEYSDARAKHDQRALFYKRFLILMWGMHERTDVFGPFMAKGTNWLSQTTHSERFRFVHDEEDVLTDGRPTINEYIAGLNAAMGAGSRVLAYWKNTIDGINAPALAERNDYRVSWKFGVDLAEDISESLVTEEKGCLYAKCPSVRSAYSRNPKAFSAKVRICKPAELRPNAPESVIGREVSEGLLCLDQAMVEDIDYYANSRAAREHYLRFAHLLNMAREILASDQKQAEQLASEQGVTNDTKTYAKALRLWRSGNKWQWPSKDAHHKAIAKIMNHLNDKDDLTDLFECQERLVRGGVKANGDVFALCDTLEETLPDGTPLPWLEERVIGNVKTGKVKKTDARHWEEHDRPGEMTLYTWEEAKNRFLDRVAPMTEFTSKGIGSNETRKSRQWQIARGLFSADNVKRLGDIAQNDLTPREVLSLLENKDKEEFRAALLSVFENYQSKDYRVSIPKLRTSLGLAWGIGEDAIPRAYVIDAIIDMRVLSYKVGEHDLLNECLDRIYAHPDQVLERIAQTKSAATLVGVSLKTRRSLVDAWHPHLFLSFENEEPEIFITHEMPKDDPRIGWREILGSTLVEKDARVGESHFVTRGWTAEALLKGAERLSLLTGPGGEEAIQACFQASRSSSPSK